MWTQGAVASLQDQHQNIADVTVFPQPTSSMPLQWLHLGCGSEYVTCQQD